MLFSSLRTVSFRNLADAEVNTCAKDVFLVGENGQGKTNFLEALYFCAYASSFRAARDSELAQLKQCSQLEQCSRNDLISHNVSPETAAKDFSAAVKLSQSINDEILVKFEKGKKSIFINGKRAEERKELLSIAPSIVFCHEDMEFVSGSPERRRWFFDQTLSFYDPVYLEDLRRYRHVLKSRNAILKDSSLGKNTGNTDEILDALDPQFAMYGINLMKKRETAAQNFSEVFSSLYEEVSGISGITVQYLQSWKSLSENEVIATLRQKRAAETAAGLSLSGPHRDRYVFAHRNGADFTVTASTGQRRLLALLLRAAQAIRFSAMTNLKPIFLLDDVLLEMDGEKRRRFLYVLPAYDQAFYTFLPDEPYQRYQKEDTLVYKVRDGACQRHECSL